VEIEHARQRAAVREERNSSNDEDNLFADGPLADEAWTARCEQELKANVELEIKLNGRLDGSVSCYLDFRHLVTIRSFHLFDSVWHFVLYHNEEFFMPLKVELSR